MKKLVVLAVVLMISVYTKVYASFSKDVDEEISDNVSRETSRYQKIDEAFEKIVSATPRLQLASNQLRDEIGRFRRPDGFAEELWDDTKKVFGNSWNAGYIFSPVGADSRMSAGTTLVAWKFIAVDGAVTYSPIESNRKADFEFQFPIRIERIPIGAGLELRDVLRRREVTSGWYDYLVMRLVLSHSPTSGLFGFGFRVGLEY